MKFLPLLLACGLIGQAAVWGEEDGLDRVEEALSFSLAGDAVRARLSGTLELEAYTFSRPASGLLDTSQTSLLSPRATFFLDAQLGPRLYFFAQARVDRGFDPSDGGWEVRLDEYALRLTLWESGRLNLQLGKFATVVGRWNERHLAWDNPFINAPLPYENVSAVSDLELPGSAAEFRARRITPAEKYEFSPIVWGPSYATGVSLAGRSGTFDYVAELKNASLSSRPEAWALDGNGFAYPTISGRLGFRPSPVWNFGFSASRGAYLREEAAYELPRGRSLGDYHELVLAQDAGFAWHHWQVWAEIFEARYQVPNVGQADTLSYCLEAKYKFTPQLFAALRWNQQFFGRLRDGERWREDVWRVDAAIGYRFTPHTQLKLQYDLGEHDSGRDGYGHLLAAQLMVRF